MRKSLGALLPAISVGSATDFLKRTFERFQSGPELIRPKRVGSYEPLQPVQSADLIKILGDTYILSNGRKMNATVSTPIPRFPRFFSVSMHLEVPADKAVHAD